MALDKLVDSTQLDTDLTTVADAIRAKSGGSSQLAFPAGFVSEIGNIPSGGGGDNWVRPAEWPDYSKLDLLGDEIEAEFFTYDNREAAWGVETLVGLYARCSVTSAGVIKVERVRIEGNGSITVLDTATYNQNSAIKFSVPLDAGDYVCYRLTPVNGHITGIAMTLPAGISSVADKVLQRCVERYGNLPYCTGFYSWGAADRCWGCMNLISDTILSMAAEVAEIDYAQSFSLENLPMDGWTTVKNISFTNCCQLKSVDFSKFDLSEMTSAADKFQAFGLAGDVDMSNLSFAACTNAIRMFGSTGGGSRNMRTFRSPTGLNNLTNTSDFLNGCTSLQVVEMDASFSQSSAGIGSRFCPNKNVKAMILRGESVCPLSGSGILTFLTAGGGYCYVPQSVLADYKAATNWSTVANYILPIEGSYWETHHADGSLIEEVAA